MPDDTKTPATPEGTPSEEPANANEGADPSKDLDRANQGKPVFDPDKGA